MKIRNLEFYLTANQRTGRGWLYNNSLGYVLHGHVLSRFVSDIPESHIIRKTHHAFHKPLSRIRANNRVAYENI